MSASPRDKVLAYRAQLSRLVVTATLAGTVACSKCSSTTGGGYGVVDPMPPPAKCYGLGVSATAAWVTTDAGARAVRLEISAPTYAGARFTPDPLSVLSGTLVSTEATPSGLEVVVVPEPGRGSVIMTLDVTCAAGPGGLNLSASWGSTADGGQVLTTHVTEI